MELIITFIGLPFVLIMLGECIRQKDALLTIGTFLLIMSMIGIIVHNL